MLWGARTKRLRVQNVVKMRATCSALLTKWTQPSIAIMGSNSSWLSHPLSLWLKDRMRSFHIFVSAAAASSRMRFSSAWRCSSTCSAV